jgi:hypothetical protein
MLPEDNRAARARYIQCHLNMNFLWVGPFHEFICSTVSSAFKYFCSSDVVYETPPALLCIAKRKICWPSGVRPPLSEWGRGCRRR